MFPKADLYSNLMRYSHKSTNVFVMFLFFYNKAILCIIFFVISMFLFLSIKIAAFNYFIFSIISGKKKSKYDNNNITILIF